MKELATRLKHYRKRKLLTQNQVASYLGYKSFTTIQKWEDGSSEPSLSILYRLCDLYEVSFDVLVNGAAPILNIPLLGDIRAGDPIFAQEVNTMDDLSVLYSNEYFYLNVIGDSMKDARIYEGDQILVKSTPVIENGKIAVVLIGDEATVKRVYKKKGKLILHPENKDYQDMVFSEQDILEKGVKILGEVIENKIRIQ
ncbi:MAG: helix-turn-helix domain-containing protein [Erysipelothrix sp.]|nr:helix-turn-helix domain-containing protein [Erysipelothrix sp.]